MKSYERLKRKRGQQERRKNEFREERDMWKRIALRLPGRDGHYRFPRLAE